MTKLIKTSLSVLSERLSRSQLSTVCSSLALCLCLLAGASGTWLKRQEAPRCAALLRTRTARWYRAPR